MTGLEGAEKFAVNLCGLIHELQEKPSRDLAKEALVEAECLAAALQAYLFRHATAALGRRREP